MGDVAREQFVRKHNLHKVVNDMIGFVLRKQSDAPVQDMIDFLRSEQKPAEAQPSNDLLACLSRASALMREREGCELTEPERQILRELNSQCAPPPDVVVQRHGSFSNTTVVKKAKGIAQAFKKVVAAPDMYKSLVRSQRSAEILLQVALQLAQSTTDNTSKLINDLITGAARLLSADRCTFFLVDGNELVSKIAEGSPEIRIPIGVGIAGLVARTGEKINLADAWADSRFNNSVDKETGYRTRSLLCMPVHYEEGIIAVAQLLNKEGGFTKEDEEVFEAFATFAAVCIRNQQLYVRAVQEKRKNELLLSVIERLSKDTDIRNLDKLGETIVDGAREILKAARCNLFLLNKATGSLESKLNGELIKCELGSSIVGHVAETGEVVNVPDAYSDSRFDQTDDHRNGFVTKSILATPVFNNNREVVGVIQGTNKLGMNGVFTTEDEQVLSYFSFFAGIAIQNASLYDFVLHAGQQQMELIAAQNGVRNKTNSPNFSSAIPTLRELETYKQLIKQISKDESAVVLTPQFNVHQYSLLTEKHMYVVPFTIELFKKMNFITTYQIDENTLWRFLIAAKKKYRNVPYHSITHAFDVTQTVFLYLHEYHVSEFLTDLDCFVLMVSAYLHDIDHMGLNNSFHLKAQTPLGVLSSASGATSVLEVHHCALSIELLGIDECNIFKGLPAGDQNKGFKLLINNILATDMAKHKEKCDKFNEMVQHGYDKENEEHRQLLCEMVLKSADISNVTKPFEISRLWGVAMTEEFYFQGDVERQRRLTVTPQFNREQKKELASSQIGFIKAVVETMLGSCVKLWTGMQPVYEQLQSNLVTWTEMLNQQSK